MDPSRFPAELLLDWKRSHEAQSLNARLLTETDVLTSPALPQPHIPRPDFVEAVMLQARDKTRIALVGVSGAGKTQFAVELLEAAVQFRFRWWLRGGDRGALYADLARIGSFLGRDFTGIDADVATREVRALLEGRDDWLIVVDDVRDVDLLDVLPNGDGLLIITTQRSGILGITEVEMPPFDDRQATELLLTAPQIATADSAVVAAIATRCLGLPIALAQVAAYSSATGMPADHQLSLLASTRPSLMARGELPSHATLAASVDVTLERLSPESFKLLLFLSSFGESPIPIDILHNAFGGNDGDAGDARLLFEDAVAELRAFSLVSRSADFLAVHALIIEFVLARGGLTDDFLRAVSMAVAAAFPDWPERADNWVFMEAALPHAIHLLETFKRRERWLLEYGTICNKVGNYYRARGMSREAKVMMLEAIGELQTHSAEGSGEIAGLLGSLQQNVANIMADLGEHELAVATMRASLATKERVYGPEHELTAVAHSGLGNLLEFSVGDLAAAKEEYEVALRLFRVHGRPYLVADALTDLARLASSDDPDRAMDYLNEADELVRNDPESWSVLCTLCVVRAEILLDRVGHEADAAREAHRAVKVAELYAEYSKELADALACLGGILLQLGQFGAAVVRWRRCLEVSEQVHTSELVRATRLGNLGLAMACRGDVEGVNFLEQSLNRLSSMLPEGHPAVEDGRRMLVQGLMAVGDGAKVLRTVVGWQRQGVGGSLDGDGASEM